MPGCHRSGKYTTLCKHLVYVKHGKGSISLKKKGIVQIVRYRDRFTFPVAGSLDSVRAGPELDFLVQKRQQTPVVLAFSLLLRPDS